MPNIIDANGLQTATSAELTAQFVADFQTIYGTDIVTTPDSPDGQMIGIFVQAVLDLEDLLTQIYNGFDPDTAIGKVLDQRVAINGIQRKAGTYTITNIQIVTNQSVTLNGLDTAPDNPYTISDSAGTRWYLANTVTTGSAGTFTYQFRAQNPGATLTIPNTITIPVTIVLGVQSVNNPTTYLSLGLNEETDAQLRIRRLKSVALSSQGYLAGLIASLNNITGITGAYVYENNTGVTDANGIPGHSIWVIVNGLVSDADVATAIYNKRNAGCGMKGAQSYTITQLDGSPFVVRWDVVQVEDLYIKFNVSSIDGVNAPFYAQIRAQLPALLTPDVGETVNINEVATLVQQIDKNTLVTSAGLGLVATGPFTNIRSPSALNKQFGISSANIILLPIYVTPPSPTINDGDTLQLTALGGFGAFTWSVVSGGGSVNSSGLYTAPATPTVATVRATDSQGNYGDAVVTVV